jgi:hypothetical protein
VATDINQLITLGVGIPADIEHLVLFGLTIAVIGEVSATLHERSFGSCTLDDRDIAVGLYERKFGSCTLEDRA